MASRSGWVLSTGSDAADGLGFSADEGFLFEYAIVSIGLALCSLLLRIRGSSLLNECRQLSPSFGGAKLAAPKAFRVDWFAVAWMSVLVGVAAFMGLGLLGQPLRYDEAFTYLTFIEPGGSYLFYYPLPNNHVLYTLVASASSFFFGPSPASIRWPALAFSIAAVILAFRLGRKVSGEHGGFLMAVGIALCPILVSYSVLARGYSLLILVTLAMLNVGFDDIRFPWKSKPAALALLASTALLVMPSAAYMVAGIALWAVAMRIRKRLDSWLDAVDFLLPFAAMGLLFTAAMYLPVLLVNSFDLVVQNRFFVSIGTLDLIRATTPHLQATWNELTRDVNAPGVLAVGILAAIGLRVSIRKHARPLWLLLPSIIVGSAIVFILKHSIPFPRTWMYVIPVVLLVADSGFACLVGTLRPGMRKVALVVLLIGAAFFAAWLLESRSIESATDAGAAPDAPQMSATIDSIAQPGDWLCARVPTDVPLRYYLKLEHPTGPTEFKATGRVHFIAEDPFVGNSFVSPLDVRPVAKAGGLVMYTLLFPMSIDKAGDSFHCWLRSGIFLA